MCQKELCPKAADREFIFWQGFFQLEGPNREHFPARWASVLGSPKAHVAGSGYANHLYLMYRFRQCMISSTVLCT